MLENLTVIAVGIIILWGLVFGIYVYSSQGHGQLQADIEAVEQLLEKAEAE